MSYVDVYAALNVDDLADGVHPDVEGYAKIADVWTAEIVRLVYSASEKED